ncbi:hypothetical protein [Streptomyces sp. NPDC127072]|uniref:hypothetical protein n=1 Tax=Streptomyces sp. NPDC127072 TaxID=3347129 RepID=UPI003649DF56
MDASITKDLPDWRDDDRGGLARGALWLMLVVGIGNVFTKSQLREAFPDIAQIDRRIRDLRDWGWVIDTSREDASLKQSEQRFVKPGISVWDPAERKKRNRTAIPWRTQERCRDCGQRGSHLPHCPEGPQDHGSEHGVSELAARTSSLPLRDRTRLLTWIAMGERPRTPVEDIWAQYQQLSDADQQQLARHLARLLNEDTQAEDAMP